MTNQTKTEGIFNSTNCSPWTNSAQTNAMRLVFVCSAGMLRSPTAQMVASRRGHNARAGGSMEGALIPLSVNLIEWADSIFFMNMENFNEAELRFKDNPDLLDVMTMKSTVWNIPDQYNWGDIDLWNIFENHLAQIGL